MDGYTPLGERGGYGSNDCEVACLRSMFGSTLLVQM